MSSFSTIFTHVVCIVEMVSISLVVLRTIAVMEWLLVCLKRNVMMETRIMAMAVMKIVLVKELVVLLTNSESLFVLTVAMVNGKQEMVSSVMMETLTLVMDALTRVSRRPITFVVM